MRKVTEKQVSDHMIKRALISVSDKTGLDKLLRTLAKYDVEIISSGGTAKRIRELGYECTEVSDYTGFPESPGGYVKTMHPKIHGGVAHSRVIPKEAEFNEKHNIPYIDLVVVKLYPSDITINEQGATVDDVIENIDIGGPAVVRNAAKSALRNGDRTVVTNPAQYDRLIKEMEALGGDVSLRTKITWAHLAFKKSSEYDGAIANYFGEKLSTLQKEDNFVREMGERIRKRVEAEQNGNKQN